ncbi:zinc ribbon domain-containing protein [Salinifilum aidingensis]
MPPRGDHLCYTTVTRTAYKCRVYKAKRELARAHRKVRHARADLLHRTTTNLLRAWTCPHCRTRHDRDHNAAKNILTAGRAIAGKHPGEACGADVRPQGSSLRRSAWKQEPRARARGEPPPLGSGEKVKPPPLGSSPRSASR